MILSIGLRTDIVQNYSEWLIKRFDEGKVYARNPLFTSRVSSYELTPERIDAIFFRSMDYTPILSNISNIVEKYRTLFHFVINGYGHELEPKLAPLDVRLETLKALSKCVGKERLYWRYDPVILTKTYDIPWHIARFGVLAAIISPYVCGCIVNFPDRKAHTAARIPTLQCTTTQQKRTILESMKQECAKLNLPLRVCGMSEIGNVPAVMQSGCVTLSDIAAANHCKFKPIPHRGNKRACICIECRDIGWYDSCPSDCAYCTLNRDDKLLAENIARHDINSPLLIGNLMDGDLLQPSPQTSFLAEESGQLTLFDF